MLKDDFFKILEINTDKTSVRSKIELNKNHVIFEGHFPEFPIVPGVCQIQIINELTSEVLQKKLTLRQAKNIKFTQIIDPEKNEILDIDLQLESKEKEVLVRASIFSEDIVFLKFKGLFTSQL